MSLGYWISIAVWALLVAAALRPPMRPVPLARAAFLLSVAANEIPLILLVVFAIPTVRALATDDSGAPGRWLGAGTACAITAGFLLVYVRTVRDRAIVAREVGLPAGARRASWSAVLPLPVRPRGVERRRDLPYSPDGGRTHRLDVYRHRSTPPGAPVLVYFHGGGFSGGDKHFESRHLWYRMAQAGWVVVSANYGLRPATGFPGHLIDAKRAIAWVREHAAELGAGGDTLAVAGSSAGGHIAVMCALTGNRPEFQPGFEAADTRVSGAIGLYGYYGRYYGGARDEEPSSLPADYPASAAPPVLVVHGAHDSFISVRSARALVRDLRAGSPSAVTYVELPAANHGFDVFAGPRYRAVVDGVEEFLARVASTPTATATRRKDPR